MSREAEILLAKLDEFAAELARFRAELVAAMPAPASAERSWSTAARRKLP